jgi:hypothetical protein
MTSPNTQSGEDLEKQITLALAKSAEGDKDVVPLVKALVQIVHQRESALLDKVEAEAPKDWYPTADPGTVHIRAAGYNNANEDWRKALSSVRKEHGL